MSRAIEIKERITTIKKDLGNCCLIAVSKYTTVEDIELAYQAGQRDFGESRVQDLKEKSERLQQLEINWHFIGRLQSNKINGLLSIKGLKYIHSIDSLDLLNALIKRLDRFNGDDLGVMLQYNTSDESEKGGFDSLEQLKDAARLVSGCPKLNFAGLMTIGRIRTENFEEDARKSFSQLVTIKDSLDSNLLLSMGMSSDYRLALEYGTNFVRIGSAIFG